MQNRIGQYSIVRRLAVGGMAELFLARWRSIAQFEKLVAVKRILPQHACSEDFVRMFLAEARLAAHLDHSNVVQVYDVGEHEGSYFFAMEYVHGRDLRRITKECERQQQTVPLEHALSIIIGVCAGLHHAHTRSGLDGVPLGIVHRDISPPNVLVTFEGGIKVVDFGIAKAATAQVLTAAGTLKGKIPYMSPEQCRCESLDRRSDIFSIGILLWELTVGKRLFGGDNELAILQQISKRRPPKPSAVVPGYPRDLEQIVMRALANDPAQRYETAEAMLLDLEAFAFRRHVLLSPTRLGYFMSELFAEARRRPTLPTDVLGAAAAVLAEMTADAQGSAPSRPFAAVHQSATTTAYEGAMAIDLATQAASSSYPSHRSNAAYSSMPSGALAVGSSTAATAVAPSLVGADSVRSDPALQPTVRYDLDALGEPVSITAASRLQQITASVVATARRRPLITATSTVALLATAIAAAGWANAERPLERPVERAVVTETFPSANLPVNSPASPPSAWSAATEPMPTAASVDPNATSDAMPGSTTSASANVVDPGAPANVASPTEPTAVDTPPVASDQASPTRSPPRSRKKHRRRPKSRQAATSDVFEVTSSDSTPPPLPPRNRRPPPPPSDN